MSHPGTQRVTVIVIMATFVLLTAVGCAARRPALVESKDLVAVSVMPAGPKNWLYTVETKNAEFLTSVEFISPDLEGCKVLALPEEIKITQQVTPDGIKVDLWGSIYGEWYTQFRSLQLVLTSDRPRSRGEIDMRVTDFRGNTTTIESIAGPVAARIGTPRYAWQRAWRSYEVMPQHFGRFPDNLVGISFIGN
ncbi:MAG: hypothetical protein F4Z81_04710 [Gemmatimonadetes bacterium]|nr:hypothetical protein [Gemmatimonadota bacterium]MYB60346.1 hypothetical protein [Gemmatimonadota bacterium]